MAIKNSRYKTPDIYSICMVLNGDNYYVARMYILYEAYINTLSTLEVLSTDEITKAKFFNEDWKQIISIAFLKSIQDFARLMQKERSCSYPAEI